MSRLNLYSLTFALLTVLICSCSLTTSNPEPHSPSSAGKNELNYSALFSAYMGLEHRYFFYTSANGDRFMDELQQFKSLEKIYIDTKERLLSSSEESPSEEDHSSDVKII